EHREELRRGAAGAGLHAADGQAQGGHPRELEAGRGRDHRARRLGRRGEAEIPERLEVAQAVPEDRAPAQVTLQSERSATRGSSRLARRAGWSPATRATAATSRRPPPRATGSTGPTP